MTKVKKIIKATDLLLWFKFRRACLSIGSSRITQSTAIFFLTMFECMAFAGIPQGEYTRIRHTTLRSLGRGHSNIIQWPYGKKKEKSFKIHKCQLTICVILIQSPALLYNLDISFESVAVWCAIQTCKCVHRSMYLNAYDCGITNWYWKNIC